MAQEKDEPKDNWLKAAERREKSKSGSWTMGLAVDFGHQKKKGRKKGDLIRYKDGKPIRE